MKVSSEIQKFSVSPRLALLRLKSGKLGPYSLSEANHVRSFIKVMGVLHPRLM